jgi:prepilin-type N-terminal cleavage/methylation domain-containing protein
MIPAAHNDMSTDTPLRYPLQTSHRTGRAGFTLIEMAIVLLIVTLLLGGLIAPLSSQIEQRNSTETKKRLEQAKEALLGFAVAAGRLPCPASGTSNGLEAFCSSAAGACTETTIPQPHGRCAAFYNGFLPAASIGITPVDAKGYAVDGWASNQNRIRYAVADTTINGITFPFTRTDGIRQVMQADLTNGTSNLSAANLLYVCTTAPSTVPATFSTSCSSSGIQLTSKAVAVIYSLGKNAPTGGTGYDEAANPNQNSPNNDPVFVSHEPVPASATTQEYDDIVTWLSPNILLNRMAGAGRLP